ncbi:unannotated protein [freshwater metagenome]|uniref:Unannotated protein n=1 Tax=freshwater metagenome TaxID=449393 RepID=A0A6J7IN20_9ZZZZ
MGGAGAPRAEQRVQSRGPGPLAHGAEALAVLHLVAVLELLVAQDEAVGVQDALRQTGGPRRVEELRGVVRGGVDRLELGRGAVEQLRREDQHRVVGRARQPVGAAARVPAVQAGDGLGDLLAVRLVRHDQAGAGVADAVADALLAVEDRHGQQDRAGLVGAQERGGRLGPRRDEHRDDVLAPDAVLDGEVREPVGQLALLLPPDLADGAVGALVDHRELLVRPRVAHPGGHVEALGDVPGVVRDELVVPRVRHVPDPPTPGRPRAVGRSRWRAGARSA